MTARTMTPWQVMAEPVREYLVELLCVGEQTSGDLAVMVFDRFGIGWGAVSRHLATLSASGFIACQSSRVERHSLAATDGSARHGTRGARPPPRALGAR